VAEMAQDFGIDSAVYQSKVLGNIPEGAAESVLELRWITEAQAQPEFPESDRPVIVTCDVAREGEDLTVLGLFKDAKASVIRWKARNDTMEAAGMCVAAVKEHGARILCLDDTGVGGGVTDRLRELQSDGAFPRTCQVYPKKFGEAAHMDERFANSKAEMWWALRTALRDGALALPNDHELGALQLPRNSSLISQLTAPIYEEDSRSRIRVLDKRTDNREKTRGLPAKSPDLAHALILGAWDWLHAPSPKVVEEPATTTHELLRRERLRLLKKEQHGGRTRPASTPAGRLRTYRRRRY